jgi:hypothetical protein
MQLTKTKLKQIIKEELRNILSEEGKACRNAHADCAEGQECILGKCVQRRHQGTRRKPSAAPTKPSGQSAQQIKKIRCERAHAGDKIAYDQCMAQR